MTAKKATVAPKKTVAVKEAPVKEAEVVKEAVKEAPVKVAPVKEETVKAEKAPAKKAAAPKKAAAKTAPKETKTVKTEKAAASQNVYIQFAGKELLAQDIADQAKKAWEAEGHRASSIKSLDIYVKPEEFAAYYVINGKDTGKVEL